MKDVRPLKAGAQRALITAPLRATPLSTAPLSQPLQVEELDGWVHGRAANVSRAFVQRLHAGDFVPERELDLHRMSAEAARRAIAHAFRQARSDQIRTLLIICGRGVHSGRAGPVLPDVVRGELSDKLAGELLAFSTAPQNWGGTGAWIVRLKR